MAQIRHSLSIYSQQLLILLDILFFHNMELKNVDQAQKFRRQCQKMYRQFLNEQRDQYKAYQEKMRQAQSGGGESPLDDQNNNASKEEELADEDRKYDT